MQHADDSVKIEECCFYLANSRQMQCGFAREVLNFSCFYLANSRQMQLLENYYNLTEVVFTLQTAGRYNNNV